jgi:hypothetical protein
MNDLEERLRSLDVGDGPAPSPVGALRQRVQRRRARLALGGSAVALALVAGVAVMWPGSDGGSPPSQVDTVDQPDESPSVPTTAPERPSGWQTFIVSPPPVPIVLAGPQGVTLESSEGGEQISVDPAARAFALGDTVVYQAAADTAAGLGAVFPPEAAGPVRVWSEGEVRDLSAGGGVVRTTLLDARFVDGFPIALVAEVSGTGPDDTVEALVKVDLRDDSRQTIMRRDSWESSTVQARLANNGDVIALVGSGSLLLLNRWSETGLGEWTAEVGSDESLELAIDADTAVLTSFRTDADLLPVLDTRSFDVDTGALGPQDSVSIADPDGRLANGLTCWDWLTDSQLACSMAEGPPVALDLEAGTFDYLQGQVGGVISVVREG